MILSFDWLENDVEKVEFINSIGNLIENGMITPEKLNECLANYFPITRYILNLYESVSLDYDKLELEYKIWHSEKFQECSIELNEGVAKSKTISDSKIENLLISKYKNEYTEWQEKLILGEKRKSFYYRIMESWKSNSQQIVQLSQNMRTELMSLKTQDKANEDITNEALIRHTHVSEQPIKKIKKISD